MNLHMVAGVAFLIIAGVYINIVMAMYKASHDTRLSDAVRHQIKIYTSSYGVAGFLFLIAGVLQLFLALN